MYSYANSNRFVDFQNCGDDLPYDPFQNCNITETCQSDPLIVKCESGMYNQENTLVLINIYLTIFIECLFYGDLRLVKFTTEYYNNGTSGTTGILQFCNYGVWGTVCSENLHDEDITVFCNLLGYSSKYDLINNILTI